MKIIALIIAVLSIGLAIALFMYNKPHKDIRSAKPDFTVSIENLMLEFNADQQAAFSKYSAKVLLVSGRLGDMSGSGDGPTSILLDAGDYSANCEMDSLFKVTREHLQIGDSIHVKGLFVGFDDLLGELQLKKCFVE